MTALWLRTPALWPPIPELGWRALYFALAPIRASGVHDQEEQLEFMMFWFLSIVVLATILMIVKASITKWKQAKDVQHSAADGRRD